MDILILTYSESVSWKELEGFLGCLSPARKRGVLKKKTDTDRINTLLSRLLVLSEISRRTGIPEKKIRFCFGAHGKPYLKNSKLQFSLSHTKGAVCAAFSAIEADADGSSEAPKDSGNTEIGIDVEDRSRRVAAAMYKRALSAEEQASVHSSEDFLRCWVKKEAFLKRMGTGIITDLRGLNTSILPDTASFDCGDYIIGASGRGALTAAVNTIALDELLNRYIKLNT